MSVFDSVDDDCDGVIEIKHLGYCMRAIGLMPSEKEVEEYTKSADPERAGTIEMGQFFVLIARLFRDVGEIESSAKHAFKALSQSYFIEKEVL